MDDLDRRYINERLISVSKMLAEVRDRLASLGPSVEVPAGEDVVLWSRDVRISRENRVPWETPLAFVGIDKESEAILLDVIFRLADDPARRVLHAVKEGLFNARLTGKDGDDELYTVWHIRGWTRKGIVRLLRDGCGSYGHSGPLYLRVGVYRFTLRGTGPKTVAALREILPPFEP